MKDEQKKELIDSLKDLKNSLLKMRKGEGKSHDPRSQKTIDLLLFKLAEKVNFEFYQEVLNNIRVFCSSYLACVDCLVIDDLQQYENYFSDFKKVCEEMKNSLEEFKKNKCKHNED